MNQTVSVLMPVYNGAAYVAKAIDSVLAQTYTSWELIIIDDGSTDDTADILNRYTDPRIRVLRQANQGEAVARNRGLDNVRGRYVAFLDADDLLLPSALRDTTTYLDAHPHVDVLLTDGYFCDESDTQLGRLAEIKSNIYTGDVLEPLILDPTVVTVPVCVTVRAEIIARSGVRFDSALVIGPDWDFWIQLARYAQFGYLDRVTCMYRVHQSNITKTSGTKRRTADLVRGRLKILNSPWFADLSTATQRSFFYDLLVRLLGDDAAQQNMIVGSAQFGALPDDVQAELLRLVASDHLARQHPPDYAIQCLKRSVALEPSNRKSRLLLRLADRSPALATTAVTTWQKMQQVYGDLPGLGPDRPQQVPAALLPTAE